MASFLHLTNSRENILLCTTPSIRPSLPISALTFGCKVVNFTFTYSVNGKVVDHWSKLEKNKHCQVVAESSQSFLTCTSLAFLNQILWGHTGWHLIPDSVLLYSPKIFLGSCWYFVQLLTSFRSWNLFIMVSGHFIRCLICFVDWMGGAPPPSGWHFKQWYAWNFLFLDSLYRGCYQDMSERDLPVLIWKNDAGRSAKQCIEKCALVGYK